MMPLLNTTSGLIILPNLGPVAPTQAENWIVSESTADNLTSTPSPGSPITARWSRFVIVNPRDGATLPAAQGGLSVVVRNDGSAALQLVAAGSDKVNGAASLSLPANKEIKLSVYTAGAWVGAVSN